MRIHTDRLTEIIYSLDDNIKDNFFTHDIITMELRVLPRLYDISEAVEIKFPNMEGIE